MLRINIDNLFNCMRLKIINYNVKHFIEIWIRDSLNIFIKLQIAKIKKNWSCV